VVKPSASDSVARQKLASRGREMPLRLRNRALEALNRISLAISGELDRDRLVQKVVDGATCRLLLVVKADVNPSARPMAAQASTGG
jgi:hypothetical protein